MRQLNALLLNDVHIGAVRSAGTTIKTRAAIQQYLLDELKKLIWQYLMDLVINGDLFDGYEVDNGQVLLLYMVFHEYLESNPSLIIDLILGNHDVAKNSQRTSSFAFLCTLLKANFPDQVRIHDKGLSQIAEHVWVIPHCVNQDAFDVELQRVLDEVEVPGYLLLHANYDNNFAVESDHSLNVSEDWARKLVKSKWTLVFAHEHQRRNMMAGQVIITGNQWPTSVSDCMAHGDAQKDGKKFVYVFRTEEDFGTERLTVSLSPTDEPTWQADGDFTEMDWRDLQPSSCRFIRVTGEADATESADMINAIARYRQKSEAFVITNAVKVAGIAGISEMAEISVERLQAVDVLKSLCEKLEPHEADRVCDLLDKPNQLKSTLKEAA